MEINCEYEDNARAIATMLRNIPKSTQEAKYLHNLCPNNKNNPICKGCTTTLVSFLQLFDSIKKIKEEKNGELKIKAKTVGTTYFFKSLATYLEKNYSLVSSWKITRAGEDLPPNKVFDLGSQLLYQMERKKTAVFNDYSPTRYLTVSQAIIKAKVEGENEPKYLLQHDEHARWFQLIGGRKRSRQKDALHTMKDEIESELPLNNLQYGGNYSLNMLIDRIEHKSLSPTYGAYTKYRFTIFQAFFKLKHLKLQQSDKWLSLEELLYGGNRDIIFPPDNFLVQLDKELGKGAIGGFEKLPLSLETKQLPNTNFDKKKKSLRKKLFEG